MDPYNLDAAIAEAAGEPFTFTFRDRQWQLPPVGELSIAQLSTIDEGFDGFLAVVRQIDADLADELNDNLNGHGFAKMSEAWMNHSGTTPGESLASPS